MKLLAFIAAFVVASSAASATVVTSVSRAEFLAAVAGGTINGENFDGLAVGSTLGTLNGVTYAASGGSVIVTDTFLTSTAPNGIGSTSTGFFLSTETATFTFDTAITAFAIDINTFANTDGGYQAVLSTGDSVTSVFEVFSGFSTGQFLGFVTDAPFTSLTISALTGFSFTLDTLAWGDAAGVVDPVIPVPGALVLLLTGLGGLGLIRRRA